jgi:fructose-1,6-bisphosphatase/inositol monophosphatase family enzyme
MDWLGAAADVGTAEIMPRFRNLGDGAVQQKTSAADLVTEADVSAERAITDALLDRFDGAVVIGEEAVSENPALLDGWSRTEGRFSWSIRSTAPSISLRAWPLSV